MVKSSPSTAGHHEPPVICGASAKETAFEALIDIEVFASSHRLALVPSVDMGETQDAWSPSRLCLSTMTKPILPLDGARDSNWNGSRGGATPSVQCHISISEANPRTPATVTPRHTASDWIQEDGRLHPFVSNSFASRCGGVSTVGPGSPNFLRRGVLALTNLSS